VELDGTGDGPPDRFLESAFSLPGPPVAVTPLALEDSAPPAALTWESPNKPEGLEPHRTAVLGTEPVPVEFDSGMEPLPLELESEVEPAPPCITLSWRQLIPRFRFKADYLYLVNSVAALVFLQAGFILITY